MVFRKRMAVFLFAAFVSLLAAAPAHSASETDWTNFRLIAHAMGGINGTGYTNTYEAFLVNYEKGHRLFEVDLILSEDGKLVARHDWLPFTADYLAQDLPPEKKGSPLTLKEFKNTKVLEKYNPLTFYDILQLMREYPDVYFVTDTKELDPDIIRKQFRYMANAARSVDASLLNRIIPEIYSPEMFDIVAEIYRFPSVIYSLYLSSATPEEVVKFADGHGISVVAMPVERATKPFIDLLNEHGIRTYVHTTNSLDEVKSLQEMGVYGFYTDFLTYRALRNLEKQPVSSADAPQDVSINDTAAGNDKAGNVSAGNDSAANHSAGNDTAGNDAAGGNGTGWMSVTVPAMFLLAMQIVFLIALRKYKSGGILG